MTQKGPACRQAGFAPIFVILGIVIAGLVGYVVLIGFPEKTHCGENLSCHGIPLNNRCLGYKSTFAFIDCAPTKTQLPSPTSNSSVDATTNPDLIGANWKTYTIKNNGFEIRLPKDFADSGPSLDEKTNILYFYTCFKTPKGDLSYCINRNGFGEITLPFLKESPKLPICREEEKTMFVNNQLQKLTYSTYQGPQNIGSFSDCNSIPSTSITDQHSSEILTCLDKELKAYPSTSGGLSEAQNLCQGKDSLYRLSLICKGRSWEGKEGMTQCSQLFDQILSTFKFLP